MFHVLSLFLIHILPFAYGYDSIKDLGILEDFKVFKKTYEKIEHEDFKSINIVPLYRGYSSDDEEAESYDYITFAISEQKNIKDIEYVKTRYESETEDRIMGESDMNHRYKIPECVSLTFRGEMEKLEEQGLCKYSDEDLCGMEESPYILLDDQVQILIQLIEEYQNAKSEAFRQKFKYLFWLLDWFK